MQQKEYPQIYELGLGSLIGDFFQNVKDTVSGVAKAVAPIAPYVLPFIPGIGPIAKLGIGAGINLAAGQKPVDVAKNLAIQAALTGITGGFKGTATKAPIDTGAVVPPSKAADIAYRDELLSFFDEKVPGIKSSGIQEAVDPSFFQKVGGSTKDFFTEGYGARLNPFSEASKLNPKYLQGIEAGLSPAELFKMGVKPERSFLSRIAPSAALASAAVPFFMDQPEDDYMSGYDLFMSDPDYYKISYSADGGPVTGFAAGSGQKIEHPNGKVKEHPRRIGEIAGPGTGTSDEIPAMLSDGEFVMTAQAVRNAGGGSRKAGAKNMYKLMKSLEKGGSLSEQSLGMVGRA
jgi:hypothetical protein